MTLLNHAGIRKEPKRLDFPVGFANRVNKLLSILHIEVIGEIIGIDPVTTVVGFALNLLSFLHHDDLVGTLQVIKTVGYHPLDLFLRFDFSLSEVLRIKFPA